MGALALSVMAICKLIAGERNMVVFCGQRYPTEAPVKPCYSKPKK
jgi:hypothetical protein